MVNFLTKEKFIKLSANNKKYWSLRRWQYMSVVVNMLKNSVFSSVLEIGTNGIKILEDSKVLDFVEGSIIEEYKEVVFDFTGVDYNHDITKIPWPFKSGEFDFIIALQVFEHLDENRIIQKHVFDECLRVSNNLIISIPFGWKTDDKYHRNITDKDVIKWSSGRLPKQCQIVGKGRKYKIYHFEMQ